METQDEMNYFPFWCWTTVAAEVGMNQGLAIPLSAESTNIYKRAAAEWMNMTPSTLLEHYDKHLFLPRPFSNK